MIAAKTVKELRERSGAGFMDCKKALQEVDGDIEKAIEYLRKSGAAKAQKKAGRSTKEGSIVQYIHPGGKLGVLVEINCETDFVAKTEDFQLLAKDVAMHIAASSPISINIDDVSNSIIKKEKEIYSEQARNSGKPENIIEKMIKGRIIKFYKENEMEPENFVTISYKGCLILPFIFYMNLDIFIV